jgi:hypothetical protein
MPLSGIFQGGFLMAELMKLMAPGRSRRICVTQFARLIDVAPEAQGFANLANFNQPTGLT